MTDQLVAQDQSFRLDEATIDELHEAIRAGRTTCVAVVRHYIERVRAFNGVASALVTEDGAPVPAATGTVRAMAPLRFPTQTVKASTILPDLDKYNGPPLEYGRMEPTASDPSVPQQFGMIVGIPNAGQANALATLNIRGERSVTCRGDFDRHPSKGPLPPGAPPVCEFFRRLPDALERAAELDATYGRYPDLEMMPMYGVVFSFKDSFDTKDMRSTGGGDARYDIDVPARDHVLVEQLRNKGAIIFAKAVNTEYNGRAGDPGGRHRPDQVLPSTLGYQRSTWGGNPSNPYDTTRSASLGSSSGSALSVSINLVMASLGEETRASCRGPSNHNAVALILPHKSMLGFDGGAIGADIYCDRSGIHCRTIADCAKVLDALKDPVEGYYDPRDVWTTVPRSSVLSTPYANHAKMPGTPGALEGFRLGIIRESMVYPPGSKTEEPIVTAAAKEIKTVLGDRLGATLVESSDPLWTRDPDIEAMKIDFRSALARLVPVFMPDLLFRLGRDGQPVFKEFAAAIVPTEFMPGKVFGSGTMRPIDYCVELAEGRIAPPSNLDLATVQQQELAMAFRFHIPQYLSRRVADWKALGFTETLADFAIAQCAFQVLGRRSARSLQELGRGLRPAQSARPAPGRQRAHHAARITAAGRHDGDPGEPSGRSGAPAHALAAGTYRGSVPVRYREQSAPRVVERTERGPDRGADPGRLRHDRLRSGVLAQQGRDALRVDPVPHADHHCEARPAVLAGVPGRARQGGRPPENRLGLRGGLEAPDSSARLRSTSDNVACRQGVGSLKTARNTPAAPNRSPPTGSARSRIP